MSDLGDILDALHDEDGAKPTGRSTPKGEYWPTYTHEPSVWTDSDKKVEHPLMLNRYQAYWLMTRVRVHLRSYEAVEWSEMKEVLEQCLVKLEQLWSHSMPAACEKDSTSTPVEDVSAPLGTAKNNSPLSSASDAEQL